MAGNIFTDFKITCWTWRVLYGCCMMSYLSLAFEFLLISPIRWERALISSLLGFGQLGLLVFAKAIVYSKEGRNRSNIK